MSDNEPELDLPQILGALSHIRDDTTNPEVRILTKLIADLCFHIIDLEEEIEERDPTIRGA